MKKKLRSMLTEIISQGDTSLEYRYLIKDIVQIHRECFTEENIPTTESYLMELLHDALDYAFKKESMENFCAHDEAIEIENDIVSGVWYCPKCGAYMGDTVYRKQHG